MTIRAKSAFVMLGDGSESSWSRRPFGQRQLPFTRCSNRL